MIVYTMSKTGGPIGVLQIAQQTRKAVGGGARRSYRVTYSPNRTRGLWAAHGRYVVRETAAARALWLAAAMVYCVFWLALSLAVNAKKPSPAQAAMALAGAWLSLNVLIPAGANAVANAAHPIPPRAEDVGFERGLQEQGAKQSRDEILREYALRHPEYGDPTLMEPQGSRYFANHAVADHLEGLFEEEETHIQAAALPAAGGPERPSVDGLHSRPARRRPALARPDVDDATREALAIEVDTARVRRVLANLIAVRGQPLSIVSDNGPDFRSRALAAWALEAGVRLHAEMFL